MCVVTFHFVSRIKGNNLNLSLLKESVKFNKYTDPFLVLNQGKLSEVRVSSVTITVLSWWCFAVLECLLVWLTLKLEGVNNVKVGQYD